MRRSASSILTECRELTTTRLSELATRLMEWVPGMLAERAEKATEVQLRAAYLRARGSAPSKAKVFVKEFKGSVDAAFEKLAARSPSTKDATKKKVSARELTLVDHEDLSESLRVRELIRVLGEAAAEQIVELQPRMALLANAPELSDEDNPLSPLFICNAFGAACENFDGDARVRMVVLDVFADRGVTALDGLYRDINALLVERDVLPVPSFSVKKSPAQPSGMTGGRAENRAGTDSGGAASAGLSSSGSSVSNADLFALLQGLVAANMSRTHAVPMHHTCLLYTSPSPRD